MCSARALAFSLLIWFQWDKGKWHSGEVQDMSVIVHERNEYITEHAPREETTAGREVERNSALYTALIKFKPSGSAAGSSCIY